MKPGTIGRRRPGGFTLVELITVVAILAILVTLVIGAYGGIKNYQAGVATEHIFATLDAALEQYYADYNSYPWVADSTLHTALYSADGRGDFNPVSAALLPPTGSAGVYPVDQPAAVLYNALNAQHRHGSYFPGGAGETMVKKNVSASTGLVQCTYPVYVDGWGRQIYYWPADLAVTSPGRTRVAGDGAGVTFVLPANSYQCRIHGQIKSSTPGTCTYTDPVSNQSCGRPLICPKGPVLESLGALEFDDSDNMVNWGSLTK